MESLKASLRSCLWKAGGSKSGEDKSGKRDLQGEGRNKKMKQRLIDGCCAIVLSADPPPNPGLV
jgi:hypothetical protein